MSKIDFKIVLLGQEYTGKTSLVERFIHNHFLEDDQYHATIGAAFAAKKLEVSGQVLVIGLWDTAGSEKYNAISRIYYRSAHAAIICYDVTKLASFERAKFWISELKDVEKGCRIYLCGTKKDLINEYPKLRAVDYHNVTDFADEIHAQVFETSSKTGGGVFEMFYKIAENFINSMPDKDNRNGFDLMCIEEKKEKKSCC